MSGVVVVTDSAADITQKEAEKLGIGVIPLHVIVGKKDYLDGINLGSKELLKILPNKDIVTTSQPSIKEFLKAWEEVARPDQSIISIHPSAKLSGIYSTAVEAAQERPNVAVVDSLSISLGLRFLVFEAIEMANSGAGIQAIAAKIEELKHKIRLYAVFDTLKYLERGGRIGKVKFLAGALLNVKPIIVLRNGELEPVASNRTKKKSMAGMLERFFGEGRMAKAGVIHVSAESEAEEVKASLQEKYPDLQIPVIEIGSVLIVHSGPGLFAVCGLLE